MKAHVHAWAGIVTPVMNQEFDCDNRLREQNDYAFPETTEMNVLIWQGHPPGVRGA